MPDDISLLGGLNTALGIELVESGPDRVVLGVDIAAQHLQPYGIVHGGLYCTLVETAGSIAGALWFGERGKVVGVANHTDFLRATGSGRVTAVASPVHRGRSQQLWLVEISDDESRLVARGEVRLQNLTA